VNTRSPIEGQDLVVVHQVEKPSGYILLDPAKPAIPSGDSLLAHPGETPQGIENQGLVQEEYPAM